MVPVLRLEGVIQSGGGSGFGAPRSINMANTAKLIDRAFSFSRSPAVALVINSPGGSAAQSHLIARRIMKLSSEKKKPVYAFVEDSAASGGYILALSASEVFADPFSIVGSIGVIYSSFGFKEGLEKLGIERRLETAGKNKSLLDPFLDASDSDKERLRNLLRTMHMEFKDFVKERRGSKLSRPDEELFEGDFWIGKKAVELGLIDGIGDVRSVLKNKFGNDVSMPLIAPFRGIFPFASSEMSLPDDFVQTLERKQMWSRLGL